MLVLGTRYSCSYTTLSRSSTPLLLDHRSPARVPVDPAWLLTNSTLQKLSRMCDRLQWTNISTCGVTACMLMTAATLVLILTASCPGISMAMHLPTIFSALQVQCGTLTLGSSLHPSTRSCVSAASIPTAATGHPRAPQAAAYASTHRRLNQLLCECPGPKLVLGTTCTANTVT